MNAADIAGYTYNTSEFHAWCLVDFFVDVRALSPAARDMGTEVALDQLAVEMGINREDEYSYDSSEFPKVVFASDVEADRDRCEYCNGALVGDALTGDALSVRAFAYYGGEGWVSVHDRQLTRDDSTFEVMPKIHPVVFDVEDMTKEEQAAYDMGSSGFPNVDNALRANGYERITPWAVVDTGEPFAFGAMVRAAS